MTIPDRAVAAQQDWRRLSSRMLLIHPVRETVRALPALAGLLIAGSSSGRGQLWALIGVGAVIALSIVRWLTTRYRITPDQVQLRTGLLRRRSMATPADRVRSVDVTASALHRILGLAKVQIGTGDKGSGLELDALTAAEAHQLRAELLHRAHGDEDTGAVARPTRADAIPAQVLETELVRLDPRWIRFAPFTASGLVTALAVFGIGWRILDELDTNPERVGILRGVIRHVSSTPIWLDVLQGAAAMLVLVGLLAIGGYLLSYWGFRLTRHPGGTLHIVRGLLTTRATSIEERRLRGVELNDSILLRLVHGARLEAVTTGLDTKPGSEVGKLLVPPAPMSEAQRVGMQVLQDERPLSCALVGHGPMAKRRRYVRAVLPWLVLAVASAVAGLVLAAVPAWIALVPLVPLAVSPLLAADRYRSLGHAISGGFLVIRSGSIARSRSVLARDGIIGWTIGQTYFQRRAGLATVTATTAAGDQSYAVLDVELARGLAVAAEATPGLLDQFRA